MVRAATALSGGSGEALALGPTLLPGGGALNERGTFILAAHHDTHFRFLADLRPGDLVEVEEISGRTARYRAGAGRVVRHDGYGIDRHARRPTLALVTCWPIGGSGRGPWRYVVEAQREGRPRAPSARGPAVALESLRAFARACTKNRKRTRSGGRHDRCGLWVQALA